MAETDASEQPPVTEAQPEPAPEPKPRQDIPSEVAAALRKANKEAEAMRRQLKEYEDKDKSEAEKLADRAATAERRAAEMESQLLRHQVALNKGLPASLALRLQGTTQDELEADADTLLALVAPPAPPEPPAQPGKRVPDLAQGRRDGAPKSSMDAGRERGRADREAAALKQQQKDPFAGMTVVKGT